MAIENPKDAAAVRKIQLNNVRVFLFFAPALHAGSAEPHVLVFSVFRVF
jgi:hypothetical protein